MTAQFKIVDMERDSATGFVSTVHWICSASPLRGHLVRVRTNAELLADMRAQGREIRKTKESALAFLQSAGIVDANGELAEPYRA